jgi:uncharacterized protein (DUF1778 family)
MPRAIPTIKNITTSLRITVDMDRLICEAADRVGVSKGKIYRLGACEVAQQILTDQKVADELAVRWAI